MKKYKKIACFFLVSLLFLSAQAETIYQSTDAQGNPVYSDQPSPGATTVALPPISIAPTNSSSSAPISNSPTNFPLPTKVLYKKLEIVSPINEQTIWDNNGSVTINVSVDPGLAAGDSLQIMLDSQIVGSSNSNTTFNLTNIDRGTHLLQAQILDSQKKIIKVSNTVTFYLHKAIAACDSPLLMCQNGQCQQEIAYLNEHPICQQNFVNSVAKIYQDYQNCQQNGCPQLVALKKERQAIQSIWTAQIQKAEANLESKLEQCTATQCQELLQLQQQHQAIEQSKQALQAKLAPAKSNRLTG